MFGKLFHRKHRKPENAAYLPDGTAELDNLDFWKYVNNNIIKDAVKESVFPPYFAMPANIIIKYVPERYWKDIIVPAVKDGNRTSLSMKEVIDVFFSKWKETSQYTDPISRAPKALWTRFTKLRGYWDSSDKNPLSKSPTMTSVAFGLYMLYYERIWKEGDAVGRRAWASFINGKGHDQVVHVLAVAFAGNSTPITRVIKRVYE